MEGSIKRMDLYVNHEYEPKASCGIIRLTLQTSLRSLSHGAMRLG